MTCLGEISIVDFPLTNACERGDGMRVLESSNGRTGPGNPEGDRS